MTDKSADRIAIVTVHGTGDTSTLEKGRLLDDGEKWFLRGSVFTDRLVKRLASHGFVADIVPHHWSGLNSAKGREQGAEKLAATLKEKSKAYAGVHVVGHSHGGNVANDAASMLSWRRRKKPNNKVDSITTVGTPFFKSELSLSESIGGFIFLVISALSVLMLALLAVALIALYLDANRSYEATLAEAIRDGVTFTGPALEEYVRGLMAKSKADAEGTIEALVFAAISVVPLLFIFPLAISGLRRILRLRAKKNGDAMLFSIWHPNDEAIAFLQRVERLPLTPFPKGSLWRGSRTSGIVWGVRAFTGLTLVGIGMWLAAISGVDYTFVWNDATTGQPQPITLMALAGWTIVGGLIGAPLIFAISYALARFFGGLIPEWFFRAPLNNTIGGIVKGMAFGQDGDERIGNVSTTSHAYGCTEHILQGDVATRMQAAAAESAGKLIERYRWALFSVGTDTNASLEKMAEDAMTWDSLIHTIYFDQPELADVIGDYIADEARKARDGG
jgi:hypothetical protein